MRVWAVSYASAEGELGLEWFTTKREATKMANTGDGEVVRVEVPTRRKAELVKFLNDWTI